MHVGTYFLLPVPASLVAYACGIEGHADLQYIVLNLKTQGRLAMNY